MKKNSYKFTTLKFCIIFSSWIFVLPILINDSINFPSDKSSFLHLNFIILVNLPLLRIRGFLRFHHYYIVLPYCSARKSSRAGEKVSINMPSSKHTAPCRAFCGTTKQSPACIISFLPAISTSNFPFSTYETC